MNKTYVDFNTAKLLKEKCDFDVYQPNQYIKGGNPTTLYNYSESQCSLFNDVYYAPEQWQVVEFFRLNYGIWVYACEMKYGWWATIKDKSFKPIHCTHTQDNERLYIAEESGTWYKSPQEAYSAAFDYILKKLI